MLPITQCNVGIAGLLVFLQLCVLDKLAVLKENYDYFISDILKWRLHTLWGWWECRAHAEKQRRARAVPAVSCTASSDPTSQGNAWNKHTLTRIIHYFTYVGHCASGCRHASSCFLCLTCIWFLCRAEGRQLWHQAGSTEPAWWETRWETPERWGISREVVTVRITSTGFSLSYRAHAEVTLIRGTNANLQDNCLYLVGQGHHDSEGVVFPLFSIGVDDISNEQIEEEGGG